MQYKQPNQSSNQQPKEVSSVDLDQLPQPQLTGHAWRQMGTQLICTSCSFNHISYLPPNYQLYGVTEDGKPMLRKYR